MGIMPYWVDPNERGEGAEKKQTKGGRISVIQPPPLGQKKQDQNVDKNNKVNIPGKQKNIFIQYIKYQ
ncbi:MAG: hypothetical protein OXB84_08500 [Halobacteriovoraceae bacterium]|nr:hypothetical protein [Halobacteriovoraceae bacterium]